jgi:hypothetical protein
MQKLPKIKRTGPVLNIIMLGCLMILVHSFYNMVRFQTSFNSSAAILMFASLVVFNGVNVSALRKLIQTIVAFGSILCYFINALILDEQYDETANLLLALLSIVSVLNMASMLILGNDEKNKS